MPLVSLAQKGVLALPQCVTFSVTLQGRKYSNWIAFPSPSPASISVLGWFFSIVNEYLTQAVQGNIQTRTSEGHSRARADLIFLFQILESNPDTVCYPHRKHHPSPQPQSGTQAKQLSLRPRVPHVCMGQWASPATVTGKLTVGSLSNPEVGFLSL